VLALATETSATPAPPAGSCSLSGQIYGPNPAQVGDAVGALVIVSSPRSCGSQLVEIVASGHVYCEHLVSQNSGCQATWQAYLGLSDVYGELTDGTRILLGTFHVVTSTAQPTPPRTTVVTAPPPTHATTAATTAASSSSAKRTLPAGAFPTAPPGAFDGGTTIGAPAPSDSATPTLSDTVPAFAVAVIHGHGSVALIPPALLVVALLLLAGILAAAVRYMILNNRDETR